MSEETPKKEAKVAGVSMDDFHCEVFEMFFRFTAEEVDQDAFLRAVEGLGVERETDDKGDTEVELVLASREDSPGHHAHVSIGFSKEEKHRLHFSYYAFPVESEDEKLPHVEDGARWLGEFFKADTMKVHTHTTYTFDKSFSPAIPFPFPLISTEKGLVGSLVTGMSILFPKEPPEQVIIQRTGDTTYISHSTTSEVSLKNFDLATELKRLSVSVINSLVKKQEDEGEQGGDRKHAE